MLGHIFIYLEIVLKLNHVLMPSPVVLRFISELEARVKEHPGDPGA